MAVALDPEQLRPTITRLKRARGQLEAVIRMLEEGRDCEEVVTQIAAVSKAVDRAGFTVIATGMRACLEAEAREQAQAAPQAQDQPGGAQGRALDTTRLEKLFLSLS
ncbi:metal-sensitive transcriptional regulator [Actinomyces weissii]